MTQICGVLVATVMSLLTAFVVSLGFLSWKVETKVFVAVAERRHRAIRMECDLWSADLTAADVTRPVDGPRNLVRRASH